MGYSVNSTYWEERAEMWHDQSIALAGGAILPQVDITQTYNMIASPNSPAQNDEWTNSVVLEAGPYTMSMLSLKTLGSGILTVYLDEILVLTVDLYNAGNLHNQITSTAVTVVGTGRHVIRGLVATKNAASAGYEASITKIWFKKATDTQSHS